MDPASESDGWRPTLIRGWSIDRRDRHIDKPEIHRELTAMVTEMIDVLPYGNIAGKRKEIFVAHLE